MNGCFPVAVLINKGFNRIMNRLSLHGCVREREQKENDKGFFCKELAKWTVSLSYSHTHTIITTRLKNGSALTFMIEYSTSPFMHQATLHNCSQPWGLSIIWWLWKKKKKTDASSTAYWLEVFLSNRERHSRIRWGLTRTTDRNRTVHRQVSALLH